MQQLSTFTPALSPAAGSGGGSQQRPAPIGPCYVYQRNGVCKIHTCRYRPDPFDCADGASGDGGGDHNDSGANSVPSFTTSRVIVVWCGGGRSLRGGLGGSGRGSCSGRGRAAGTASSSKLRLMPCLVEGPTVAPSSAVALVNKIRDVILDRWCAGTPWGISGCCFNPGRSRPPCRARVVSHPWPRPGEYLVRGAIVPMWRGAVRPFLPLLQDAVKLSRSTVDSAVSMLPDTGIPR